MKEKCQKKLIQIKLFTNKISKVVYNNNNHE